MSKKSNLFILILYSLLIIQPAWSDENCVNCVASAAIESDVCASLQLDLSFDLLKQQYWHQAFQNDPNQTLELKNSLQDLATKALQCGKITSCRELSDSTPVELASGWRQKREFTFFETTDASGRNCLLSSETQFENGNTSIRALVSRQTGKLSFHLPTATCAPSEYEINRRVSVTEAGVLFVDFSMVVKRFPGSWQLLKKKRTPQFIIQPNGNARILMADDIYFDIDPNLNQTVASNMYNPEMFDPAQCKSRIANNQSHVQVKMQPGMSSRIGARFTDYGGQSTERSINSYTNGLSRQSF